MFGTPPIYGLFTWQAVAKYVLIFWDVIRSGCCSSLHSLTISFTVSVPPKGRSEFGLKMHVSSWPRTRVNHNRF